MFASKNRVIAGLILLGCCTCNYPDKRAEKGDEILVDWGTGKNSQDAPGKKKAPTKKTNRHPQKDFLDSVLTKMELSFDQIKEHINLDSTYYLGDVQFFGDTVWYRNGKRPLAVVQYDGQGVSEKVLLVFNKKGICTASLMVGMDSDVDGGFDSIVLDYKIFSNYSFATTETWTHREGRKNDKITITEQFYWINNRGRILAQNNIVHTFTRPKDPVVEH